MRYDTKSARRKFWFEVFVPILNLFHLDHWVWKKYIEKPERSEERS